MSKLSEWALKATDRELEDADWAIVAHALGKAQEYLQADGVRHSWLDAYRGVAESRAKLNKEKV